MRNLLSILVVIFISASSLLAQNNNVPQFSYSVKMDKLELKFQDINGISLDNTVVYREGYDQSSGRKTPVTKKYSNVVCKKGRASNTKEINDFLTSTKQTPIIIEMLDAQGKVIKVLVLANAYISKPVKAVDGKDLAIESMDIVHQGITRIQ
jgi:phage tail-like protein